MNTEIELGVGILYCKVIPCYSEGDFLRINILCRYACSVLTLSQNVRPVFLLKANLEPFFKIFNCHHLQEIFPESSGDTEVSFLCAP